MTSRKQACRDSRYIDLSHDIWIWARSFLVPRYIATDNFFIIKNNDYINFYIKMNITNILVDRATSVISSALCGGGGA